MNDHDQNPLMKLDPAGALVPAGFAEKAMASLMQMHGELMEEKERRVDLYRRLMEKEQAVAELRMYVRMLEEKLGVTIPEPTSVNVASATSAAHPVQAVRDSNGQLTTDRAQQTNATDARSRPARQTDTTARVPEAQGSQSVSHVTGANATVAEAASSPSPSLGAAGLRPSSAPGAAVGATAASAPSSTARANVSTIPAPGPRAPAAVRGSPFVRPHLSQRDVTAAVPPATIPDRPAHDGWKVW